MKKGYWVVCYREIHDPAALRMYGEVAPKAIAAGGGKALARTSDAIEAHESGLAQRTVLIEFDSFDQAKATYASAAYQAALAHLGSAVVRDLRIIEGL